MQRLYFPVSAWKGVLWRFLLMIALMGFVCVLLWVERDGLVDETGRPIDLLSLLYFTVVTVTTTGYGDIVPVTQGARSMITFGITPVRVLIWLIFISTAYQLIFRQQLEAIQLNWLRKTMKGHTIICGFGVKGRSAADELVDRGIDKRNLLIVDPDPEAISTAVEMGLRAIRGDATGTSILLDAGIEKAATIVIAPHRDDQCVLMCLTARDLNPKIRIIASAREEENVKLIYRSGADTVISPAAAGGRLLAAATESPVAATFLEDLIRHGWGSDVFDRVVEAHEEGLLPNELTGLEGTVLLGVNHGGGQLEFQRPMQVRLKPGDILVLLKFAPSPRREGARVP
jgi:voltage-gated potassium channel